MSKQDLLVREWISWTLCSHIPRSARLWTNNLAMDISRTEWRTVLLHIFIQSLMNNTCNCLVFDWHCFEDRVILIDSCAPLSQDQTAALHCEGLLLTNKLVFSALAPACSGLIRERFEGWQPTVSLPSPTSLARSPSYLETLLKFEKQFFSRPVIWQFLDKRFSNWCCILFSPDNIIYVGNTIYILSTFKHDWILSGWEFCYTSFIAQSWWLWILITTFEIFESLHHHPQLPGLF